MLKQNQNLRLTNSDQLRKCWIEKINGEQMQVYCNGAFVIALNAENQVEVPTETENIGFKVGKFFDDKKGYTLDQTDFDLTEIKQHKGNFDIGNSRYNAKHFVSCVEALGKDTVFYQNEEITRPSYFEGSAGIGLIMPCRK